MRRLLLLWALAGLLGCDVPPTPPVGRCDGVRCTGDQICFPDTGLCGPRDGGSADSGIDGGGDGGADAGLTDGGLDAGADGGRDGGLDGGAGDAGTDAGTSDAGRDAGDSGVDAGLPGCSLDSECFGLTQRCHPVSRACVECLTDAHCLSVVPRCDPIANACAGCLSNADCTDVSTPVCGAQQQCLPCTSNAECGPGRACDSAFECKALPDSCANPQALNLPTGTGTVSFSLEPAQGLDDATAGCGTVSGPELVYRFTTTQARDVTITASPLSGSAARPVVFLRGPSCTTGPEVACDAPAAGAASVVQTNLAPGTYYVFAESAGGAPGRIQLTVSLVVPAQPPANDSCVSPQSLAFLGTRATVVGSTTLATNTSGAGPGDPSCSASAGATGRDLLYSYTTTASSDVAVTVRPVSGSTIQPVVSVRGACATAASEQACSAAPGVASATVSLTAQVAGTYFVWVDSANGSAGNFQLEVTARPTVANDTCFPAQALSFAGPTAVATGDTTWATNGNLPADPTPTCSSSARSDGQDVVYSYTLSQPRDVLVRVTPTGPSPTLWPVVSVRTSCGDAQISAQRGCVNAGGIAPAQLELVNQAAGTYFIWVDSAGSTSGPFQLEVITASPTPPPANDGCGSPQVLAFTGGVATAAGSTLQADNSGSGFDVLPTCSALARQSGRDVVYQFTTTQPQDVAVTVTPAALSTLRPVVSLRKSSCASQLLGDELVCVEQAGAAVATLTALPAGTYWVWVDGTAGTSGAFDLRVALTPPTPPPANDDCPGAALSFSGGVATVVGTTVGATNSNLAIDNAPACGTGFLPRRYGRDVVYSYALLQPRDVAIEVTPLAGSALVPAVYVRRPGSCTSFSAGDELTCVAASAGPATTVLSNQPAGVYSLFVDSNGYGTGAFSLTVTQSAPTAPPANDTCSAPAVLPHNVAVTGSTLGAADDLSLGSSPPYGPACNRFFDARDVVYAYTAPATASVTATLSPTGAYDPALLLLTGTCAASSCSRFSDAAGPGGAESMTLSVTAGQTVYFVVDASDRTQPTSFGSFSLRIQ